MPKSLANRVTRMLFVPLADRVKSVYLEFDCVSALVSLPMMMLPCEYFCAALASYNLWRYSKETCSFLETLPDYATLLFFGIGYIAYKILSVVCAWIGDYIVSPFLRSRLCFVVLFVVLEVIVCGMLIQYVDDMIPRRAALVL